MAIYAIGDVQGCVIALEKLLEKIKFDPVDDQVWFCGDLVNRGPDSLKVLRLVRRLGKSAVTVLGNHDLHFLAVAEKIRRNRADDTLKEILKAPDFEDLVFWLRHQPLVHRDRKLKTIMVHAGVYPGWKRRQLTHYSSEVEAVLQSRQYRKFLTNMYGKQPARWDKKLKGWERYRFITNSLTRMRYCSLKGDLNFSEKGPPGTQAQRWIPWYMHPDTKMKSWRIVFGHWSTLGYLQYQNIISLDSGCVWGEKLTAVQLDADYIAPIWQIKCGAS